MNHPVISSLLPVVLLIAIGFLAGKRQWIGAGSVKDLSNLVFVVLTPALLFRTMSQVHPENLDMRPLGVYFMAAFLVYFVSLAVRGFNRRSAVLALATTFSNTVMIGIPLISLAYGDAGLVTLFTLVSVHALVLLTLATLVLEFAVLREEAAAGRHSDRHVVATVLTAVRNAVIHPVPLPIIAGLLYAQTGWGIPAVIDRPLQLLGWAFGLSGLPLAVMAVAAALPIGANVFLFSQRYKVAEDLVTASVAVSTALALVSVTLVMAWLA